MPPKYDNEVRAFVFGLLRGVGGEPYDAYAINKLVRDRFGIEMSIKTIWNWNSKVDEMMLKYGITDYDIKQVIAKGLFGDQRPPEEIQQDEDLQTPDRRRELERPRAREPTPAPERLPTFNNVAEVIAYCEREGFIVGKNLNDIKDILAANNLQVIDSTESLVGMQEIFISPIEFDIEAVGRNIVANPVIQFYYALARRRAKDLDITEWITAIMVDYYNNTDPPIRLAVLYG